MIGYLVVEIEPAEPSVGEMQLDLLAKSPLGPDAVAVAYDQHSDHELGINRGSTDPTVKGHEPLPQVG
jgi:hypothetical protein